MFITRGFCVVNLGESWETWDKGIYFQKKQGKRIPPDKGMQSKSFNFFFDCSLFRSSFRRLNSLFLRRPNGNSILTINNIPVSHGFSFQSSFRASLPSLDVTEIRRPGKNLFVISRSASSGEQEADSANRRVLQFGSRCCLLFWKTTTPFRSPFNFNWIADKKRLSYPFLISFPLRMQKVGPYCTPFCTWK